MEKMLEGGAEMSPMLDRLLIAMLRHNLRGVSLFQRIANRICTTREILVSTRHGVHFLLRADDYIDRIVIREGYYESEVLDAILKELPLGGVVWDVGANFGLHAITLKVLRPDARIICFEPSPSQAARILTNSICNNLQVDVLCIGLSNVAGMQRLHVVHAGNPGMSTFHPWDQATYSDVLQCRVDAGDELISTAIAPAPDVIKLDVEGGEAAAISGLKKILSAGGTSLIFEGGSETQRLVEELGFPVVLPLPRNEKTHHALHNYVAGRWIF
jgi:FkbM family methyltransferase